MQVNNRSKGLLDIFIINCVKNAKKDKTCKNEVAIGTIVVYIYFVLLSQLSYIVQYVSVEYGLI